MCPSPRLQRESASVMGCLSVIACPRGDKVCGLVTEWPGMLGHVR